MQYLSKLIEEKDSGREVLSILKEDFMLTNSKIGDIKFHEQGILLDGIRVNVRKKVEKGQELKALLDDTKWIGDKLIESKMELDILYEDESLIFINKKSGIVCHPAHGHYDDSLENGLQYYFNKKQERCNQHLIGRLDKDTSGIVTIAKNRVAAERIILQRNEGTAKKYYYAIAMGDIEEDGCVDIKMEEYRDENCNNRLKMRPSDGADALWAKTNYEVIKRYGEYTFIRLWLNMGRMHQIRFHMSCIGHPLAGDSLYGYGEYKGLDRAALHAGEVMIEHPFTQSMITVKAPLPEDMNKFIY